MVALKPVADETDDGEAPALHCLISTPLIRDGYIYGADNEGILRCLDLASSATARAMRIADPASRGRTCRSSRTSGSA